MEKLGIVVIILLLMCLGATGFNFYKTYQGQWVYIGELCIETATGDDWIGDNCRPELYEGQNQLICNFTINNNKYRSQLSTILNMSEENKKTVMESCREYSPVTSVYVKTIGGKKE